MKKFVVRSVLFTFALAMATLFYSLQNKELGEVSDYMAAIEDKHILLKQTPSPRIILMGGSNLSFGIDSRELSSVTGIPVVNMGLHGGLGLDFILNEVRSEINEDDILIISIEYLLDPVGDYKLKQLTRSFYPESGRYFDEDLYKEFKGSLEKAQKNFRSEFTHMPDEIDENSMFGKVYRRSSFNEYGDVTAHLELNKPAITELKDKKVIGYEYWKGIGILNDFCKDASQKGAQVYYSFPPFPRSEWVKYAEPLHRFERDIINDATCLKFLNSAKEAVLDDKYFFDTVYHLGKEGRAIRTQALIEDLAAELAH